MWIENEDYLVTWFFYGLDGDTVHIRMKLVSELVQTRRVLAACGYSHLTIYIILIHTVG